MTKKRLFMISSLMICGCIRGGDIDWDALPDKAQSVIPLSSQVADKIFKRGVERDERILACLYNEQPAHVRCLIASGNRRKEENLSEYTCLKKSILSFLFGLLVNLESQQKTTQLLLKTVKEYQSNQQIDKALEFLGTFKKQKLSSKETTIETDTNSELLHLANYGKGLYKKDVDTSQASSSCPLKWFIYGAREVIDTLKLVKCGEEEVLVKGSSAHLIFGKYCAEQLLAHVTRRLENPNEPLDTDGLAEYEAWIALRRKCNEEQALLAQLQKNPTENSVTSLLKECQSEQKTLQCLLVAGIKKDTSNSCLYEEENTEDGME